MSDLVGVEKRLRELVEENERLRVRLGRIEMLHTPENSSQERNVGFYFCGECGQEWPCSTSQAARPKK